MRSDTNYYKFIEEALSLKFATSIKMTAT